MDTPATPIDIADATIALNEAGYQYDLAREALAESRRNRVPDYATDAASCRARATLADASDRYDRATTAYNSACDVVNAAIADARAANPNQPKG